MLVIDGYTQEGRDNLIEGGCTTAGELYRKMLDRQSPVGADSTIVYPSDPGFEFDVQSFAEYDGVAWTGCSLTIFDDLKVIKDQIELSKSAYEFGIPQFGSCWAQQIATVAAGGTCALNPSGREMFLARKITLSDDGRAHPMYEGKPRTFDAFTSHNDECTHLPYNGMRLSGNQHTNIQSVCITHKNGTFWAVQYHPEYDMREIARLVVARKARLMDLGFFRTEGEVEAYVASMEALHEDNSRGDLRWQLGVDDDVLDENIRCVEVKNWITKQVIPYAELVN